MNLSAGVGCDGRGDGVGAVGDDGAGEHDPPLRHHQDKSSHRCPEVARHNDKGPML